jgi:DNA-binding transcriptional MerR regulator
MNSAYSVKEYMSIKEFTGFVGMAVASLRHYDKKGVFLPAKHGAGFKNNYRYYSPTQITTVKMIRVLTEIGVPLKTIRELTQNRTPENMLKLLSLHRDKLADEIRFLQDAHSVISTYLELLNEGMSATETAISVSEMPQKRLILGDINDFSGNAEFYGEFIRFCKAPHKPKLNVSYPIGGYWDSMAAFLKRPSRPERFFPLTPKAEASEPPGCT